jgi:hypothetical protein
MPRPQSVDATRENGIVPTSEAYEVGGDPGGLTTVLYATRLGPGRRWSTAAANGRRTGRARPRPGRLSGPISGRGTAALAFDRLAEHGVGRYEALVEHVARDGAALGPASTTGLPPRGSTTPATSPTATTGTPRGRSAIRVAACSVVRDQKSRDRDGADRTQSSLPSSPSSSPSSTTSPSSSTRPSWNPSRGREMWN